MCVYSAISEWGRNTFNPHAFPQVVPPTTVNITMEQWKEYLKLLEAAKKFDDATGQPNCESEDKTAWMKEVEDRLKAIEEGGTSA